MSKRFADFLEDSFRTIHSPTPVPWHPDAPGWWGLLAVTIILTAIYVIRRTRQWRANRYRREALSRLKHLDILDVNMLAERVPLILKITALHAYPRKTVATLTGRDWLKFLDSTCDGLSFQTASGQLLIDLSYRPDVRGAISTDDARQILEMAKFWIRKHKRKGITK